MHRRNFIRTSGASVALTSITGLASARGHKSAERDYVVKVGSIADSNMRYTASVVYNKRTGKIDGTILPVQLAADGSPKELGHPDSDEPAMYDIDNEILENVSGVISGASSENAPSEYSVSTTSRSTSADQETDLWDQLQKAAGKTTQERDDSSSRVTASSTEITAQASEETLLENLIKEFAARTKEIIKRAGAYYIKSPKGTRCKATINKKPHHQLGTSIEYQKDIGDLSATLIGSALGALIGALTVNIPLIVIGTIGGGLIGFILNRLKDSNKITFALRDSDTCLSRLCVQELRQYVSGVWMGQNTNLLRVNTGRDQPPIHLESVSRVDAGYRDVVRISR